MTKLWSIHDSSFDLTAGMVDHSQSRNYENTTIRAAYQKLWDLIGHPDGQIIWCYTLRNFPKGGSPKRLWDIEVEEDQIICRIDDVAWNRIIKQSPDLPPNMKHLRSELDRKPPKGGWWDELIVKKQENGYLRSAIIRHPISSLQAKGELDWDP